MKQQDPLSDFMDFCDSLGEPAGILVFALAFIGAGLVIVGLGFAVVRFFS